MKGAYEYFIVILLGLTFVLVGFSMVEVTLNYNQARLFQETIVSLIERHNRYDSDIDDLIKDSNQNCSQCTYVVSREVDRYVVNVDFDINIIVLNYTRVGKITAYTQSVN